MKTAADAFRALEERCDIAFYITPKGKELISQACGYKGDKATKPTAPDPVIAPEPEPAPVENTITAEPEGNEAAIQAAAAESNS